MNSIQFMAYRLLATDVLRFAAFNFNVQTGFSSLALMHVSNDGAH